ncbi:MAG: GWxTD domain-containing protein [Flavobacteriales bacterium]|nr:GWxTD domain-containing protein [Flavobacteriales bacterium]
MKTIQSYILKSTIILIGVGVYLLLSISGCKVSQSVSGRNVSFLYRDLSPELRVEHKVINFEKRSIVYLRFPTEKMGRSVHEDGSKRLNYNIRYRLFSSYSAPVALDSGNFVRKDVSIIPTMIVDTIPLDSLENRYYLLECTVRDLNSPKAYTMFIDLLRGQRLNEQTVIFSSYDEGMLYHSYVDHPDSLMVTYLDPNVALYVKYFDRSFPIASPPFSTITPKPFDFTADRMITLRNAPSGHKVLDVVHAGFYQVTDDASKRTGASLFYFGPHYPEAKTVMDLSLPLRYITTNEEFQQVSQGDNIKRNVDQHWLKLGGSPERAKELIGSFYGRVQYANRYFTSYLEGWKSDRGMCYVVYGPPDIVYRSTATETWLYGEEGRYNSLSLTFTKVVNPFTSNDYRLNRSNSLKTSWYRAVEFWRQGRVLKYQ